MPFSAGGPRSSMPGNQRPKVLDFLQIGIVVKMDVERPFHWSIQLRRSQTATTCHDSHTIRAE